MDTPSEIEMKLVFDPGRQAEIEGLALLAGSAARADQLVTTYFDTPDGALRRSGYSLRIRRAGAARTQTVKADKPSVGLFARGEWEEAVEADSPHIDAGSGPLSGILDDHDVAMLQPVFVAEVTRSARDVATAQGRIECAVDMGELRAGMRAEPIGELELELVEGAPRALFDLARRINEQVPLRLGVWSKAERGYRLADGEAAGAVKAEEIDLTPGDAPGEAFRTIAQACVRHFRLNEAQLSGHNSIEAVHQTRVAIRRLRAAFSLFGRVIGDDKNATLLSLELRRLAMALGEVRDLDVLIARMGAKGRAALPSRRDEALARAIAEVSSARTRSLMIDLVEWLALSERLDDAEGAVLALARDILDKRWKRLRRRGRRLAELDPAKRHRVRIEAKKLRYAAEFFTRLFPGKKAQRRHAAFLKAMKTLQDCLGELNDLSRGAEILERAKLPGGGRKARAKLLARAADAIDALNATQRFWRGTAAG